MHPILLVGLALGAGLAWSKRSSASAGAATVKADSGLIDASEKTHPNAEVARKAILNALGVNSMTLYEMTAEAIGTQLRMPRTAANVRAYAQMAQQAGVTIAGEDDDEVGGSDSYGDDGDEVGARRRRKHRRHHPAQSTALAVPAAAAPTATKKKKKRRRHRRSVPVAPALAAAAAAPTVANVLAAATTAPQGYGYGYSSAPAVNWSSDASDGDDYEDEGEDEDEGDEVGARRSRKRVLPDWLKFSATQSKLAGDPNLIRATAQVLRAMGYAEHAAIHLQALER